MAILIEQGMFFALGFLVMGLLWLLFLPFYWRRAVRLSLRRLEQQMPLSMREIFAERDALRAEFAARTRRIEQRAEAALEARAQDRIELGRQAGLLQTLGTGLALAETANRQMEAAVALAGRERNEAAAGLSASLVEIHDANRLALKIRDQHDRLGQDHEELLSQADNQRATIASLETRAAGLEIRLGDASRALENALAARRADADEATALAAALGESGHKLQELQSAHSGLLGVHAGAGVRIADLHTQLTGEFGKVIAARAELDAQTSRAERAEVQNAEALRREKDLRTSLQRQMDMARASDANLAKRLESLRAENSRLQGELEQVRSQLAAIAVPALSASPEPDGEDQARLRAAISHIGAEMTRLAHALELSGQQDTAPVAEKLKQLQARASRPAMAN